MKNARGNPRVHRWFRLGWMVAGAAAAGCSSEPALEPSSELLTDLPASPAGGAIDPKPAELLPGRDARLIASFSGAAAAGPRSAAGARNVEPSEESAWYAIRQEGARFVASSRARQLDVAFGARGASLRPESGGAELFIGGASISRAGGARELASGRLGFGSCQVSGEVDEHGNCLRALEADRGLVVERWENRREGLEHTILVREREPGEGPLSVHVAVAGAQVRVEVSGKAALFESDSGPAFRYSGLRAWDAAGVRLGARMLAREGGLELVVDDTGAQYPITIDPLISSLVWRTDGLFGYGRDVALADVNGDLRNDLLVSNSDTVFLYRSSFDGPATTAQWEEQGPPEATEFGHSVANAGDVNGDGFEDVLILDRRHRVSSGVFEPRAYLYLGSAFGLASTPALTWRTGDTSPNFLTKVIAGAGDVNGDGFDDVIIGDPDEGDGRAYLHFGSATGLSATPSVTLTDPPNSEQFGAIVTSGGDINGDGFDDVVIGAPSDEGRVYVYLGSAAGLATTPATTLIGSQALANFGRALAGARDINRDGFDDVVVGAPGHDNGQIDEGRAFLFLGSATGLSTSPAWTVENDIPDAEFGAAVGMGDFDLDFLDDVVVGAPQELPDSGHAYTYHGTIAGLATTPSSSYLFEGLRLACGDVNGDPAAEIALGNSESNNVEVYASSPFFNVVQIAQGGAQVGASVSFAGDVNGDGHDDVIIAAPLYENGQVDEGRVLIHHGTPSGISVTPARALEIHQAGAFFGRSVAGLGDVNADGFDDIAIGAPGYDNGQLNEGRVYVYHGGPLGIPTLPARILEINQAGAGFGASVAGAGRVNNDVFHDLIVGADLYDNGQTNEGAAFVYHGSPTGISTSAAVILEGNQSNARFGAAVAGVSVNGDSRGDVIVGAPLYDNGQTDEGVVFVYHGSPAGIPTSPARVLEGNQTSANFGRSVGSAGDTNADLFGDIIIGAPLLDGGQTNEGRVTIYRGSSTGVPATASVVLESNQPNASFGSSVSGAGDVDGDGFADIIIGAELFDAGQPDEGIVVVYAGNGLASGVAPLWVVQSNQTNARLGAAVAGGGDTDADGLSDLLVGAPGFDASHADQGLALSYH